MGDKDWRTVTQQSPCTVCGKPDWCSVSTDGLHTVCRRRDNGTGRYRLDSSRVGYWIYGPAKPAEAVDSPGGAPTGAGAGPDPADTETLDRVYGELMQMLSLEPVHRQDLLKRGLSEAEIERRGYRSLPRGGREELAGKLAETFGSETCAQVPGLYRRGADLGWSLAGASGLLVPVRDVDGHVVALKVRSDASAEGSKYTYLSSKKHGGPGPGSQVHLPIAKDLYPGVVRLTEGELKADVATVLTGILTVSIPGVSCWRPALPIFEELGCKEVRLAFDSDARENPNVARALSETFKALEEKGYEVVVESWPAERGKGIDDLLVSSYEPELKRGAEARRTVDAAMAQANGLHVVLGKVVTAKDLLAREFPEPRWIVPGILPEGATILAGKPKTGKSWLALDTALAVSMGGAVLGGIQVEPGTVLYLALEDNERRLQGRLRKLLSERTSTADLELITEWPLLEEGGLEGLEGWLETHPDARLIVVDTLAKIRRRGAGKNVYAEDYAAVEPLLKLASDHGVAVLIVHHLRKAGADDPLDEISGSTGLTGGVDGVLHLKKERGRADGYLYVTGRDIEEERELALSWDTGGARWKVVGDAEEYRVTKERQEIIDCLRSLGDPAGPKEVSEALDKSYGSVKKLLWQMDRDGDVRNIGGGKYVPVTGNLGNLGTRDEGSPPPGNVAGSLTVEDQDHSDCPDPKVTGVTEVTDLGDYRGHTLVSSPGQLEMAITKIRDEDAVAVDLETTGLNPRTDRARLISLSTKNRVWLVDCFSVDPQPLFPILATKRLYFHNAIFDLGFLGRMGFALAEGCQVIDTMLMSQMLENKEMPEGQEAA